MLFIRSEDIDKLIDKISKLVWDKERGELSDETKDLLLELQGDLENLVAIEVHTAADVKEVIGEE